jgi:hypothetical protein
VIDESRAAWLARKKTKKSAVAPAREHQQPVAKTLAFIMSLAP